MTCKLGRTLALCALLLSPLLAAMAQADDKVSFITSWKAEAEHGGYYQAIAKGIFKKYGLDVTLRQGGPQINSAQLLAAGAVDFRVASNSASSLNFVQQGVPALSIAAVFQKDPSVLIAHPDAAIATMADMKGKPIAISQQIVDTWWRFLQAKFGYTDQQLRPYTFNVAPFLVDKDLIQQGYVTSEPYAIEQQGGFKPKVFLLADDAGYEAYAANIETTRAMVEQHPAIVQHFIDAIIEGWYSYLYGDPAEANALITKDNPDMTPGQIAYSYAKLKEYGIVDSGDSMQLGIGAMTDARWKDFYDSAVKVGLYPPGLDYKQAFTLQFINKAVGLAMKK